MERLKHQVETLRPCRIFHCCHSQSLPSLLPQLALIAATQINNSSSGTTRHRVSDSRKRPYWKAAPKYLTMIDKEISKPFCNNNSRPPGTFSNVQTNAKNFTQGVSERRPAAPRHVLPFSTKAQRAFAWCTAAQACEKSFQKSFKFSNRSCLLYREKKQNGISEIVQCNRGWEPGSDGLFLFQRKGGKKRVQGKHRV